MVADKNEDAASLGLLSDEPPAVAKVVLDAVGNSALAVVSHRQSEEGVSASNAPDSGHCAIYMPPCRSPHAGAPDGLVEVHCCEVGDWRDCILGAIVKHRSTGLSLDHGPAITLNWC